MALRDTSEKSGKTTVSSPSALAGLSASWDAAGRAPKIDREKWWDIFVVALNAKSSISVPPTEDRIRQNTLINKLNEQGAERNVVSVILLFIGFSGPQERNRYIFSRVFSRKQFFSRKQQPNERLKQFWNA